MVERTARSEKWRSGRWSAIERRPIARKEVGGPGWKLLDRAEVGRHCCPVRAACFHLRNVTVSVFSDYNSRFLQDS